MNRSNFPLFQITGWAFCESGECGKINSDERTLEECQIERGTYSINDKICEVVIEIKVRLTKGSADTIMNCTSNSRPDFAPQCAFGEHYTVVYSETVSVHLFLSY